MTLVEGLAERCPLHKKQRPERDKDRGTNSGRECNKRSPIVLTFGQRTCQGLLIQEAPQFAAPAWVLELTESLRFDLTDPFAGHAELLADLFKRVVSVHADAKAHPQNPLLTRR